MTKLTKQEKLSSNTNSAFYITLSDFARKMYEEYGQGILYLEPEKVGYVLPSHSSIEDSDRLLMSQVDYDFYFIVASLISGQLTVAVFHVNEKPFLTQILVPGGDWWANPNLVYA
jgi:hypothetical protein